MATATAMELMFWKESFSFHSIQTLSFKKTRTYMYIYTHVYTWYIMIYKTWVLTNHRPEWKGYLSSLWDWMRWSNRSPMCTYLICTILYNTCIIVFIYLFYIFIYIPLSCFIIFSNTHTLHPVIPTLSNSHACTSGHPQQISFACALAANGWGKLWLEAGTWTCIAWKR